MNNTEISFFGKMISPIYQSNLQKARAKTNYQKINKELENLIIQLKNSAKEIFPIIFITGQRGLGTSTACHVIAHGIQRKIFQLDLFSLRQLTELKVKSDMYFKPYLEQIFNFSLEFSDNLILYFEDLGFFRYLDSKAIEFFNNLLKKRDNLIIICSDQRYDKTQSLITEFVKLINLNTLYVK